MAVVGDNRGVRDRPVAQRPDGLWSFEDARRRREQRQAMPTAPLPPTSGDPQEDLSALALGLADNLTVDGTPLSQLEDRQELDDSGASHRPAGTAPSAEEIMRALEAEHHAAAANRNDARSATHTTRHRFTRRPDPAHGKVHTVAGCTRLGAG